MAIFKLSAGFQINQETGAIEGNVNAKKGFSRRIPDWMNMSEEELSEQLIVAGYGQIVSEDSGEPEPEKKSKKKGVFSKSKDDEEKVGD